VSRTKLQEGERGANARRKIRRKEKLSEAFLMSRLKCGLAIRQFSIAVTLLASCLAVATAGQQPQPAFPCYTVRARYTIYEADGVRELWPIGSRRTLWVEDGDDKLADKLGPDHQNKALYGEFTVCPLEPEKPGVMRHVRITSWKDLKYGPLRRR
jgi:hypothetical protein